MNQKSLAAAKYILDRQIKKGAPTTPMQLIKLVYVAHGFMLGKHGRPLLDEAVEAWKYGPVVPSVYQAVKQYKSAPIAQLDGDVSILATSEIIVLDEVADAYAGHDGVVLSSATHKPGTPWSTTWASQGKNSAIPNDVIENFYTHLLKSPAHSSL